ncbi:MAG TPA: class I SAM-dependent methyltransferase [Alloacidobacterium sp.]|nr:class I SAM-dependent methyltransferase [Alloacidobacterium sp.]
MSRRLNFNPLARPYRWLEYVSFGRALERCRFHFLPALTGARRALVLGDGDGRFLARLLEANPQLEADVIDISPAMLRLLHRRLGPEARGRVAIHEMDARELIPPGTSYDLVVTHFFLDCLFEHEVTALVDRIVPRLVPEAYWVVSEFARPQGRVASLLGQAIVSGLYRAFGLLAGLQVRSLPDHGAAFEKRGFRLLHQQSWLRGLLVSQLWQHWLSKEDATFRNAPGFQ